MIAFGGEVVLEGYRRSAGAEEVAGKKKEQKMEKVGEGSSKKIAKAKISASDWLKLPISLFFFFL